ncbi:MAG TPA: gamma-glutamyl-gamma-aminobutyrate hydrolase family protein [Candidatus Cloacimonadota bacterium]|nr:gamma-glutamyl-gamma-aminobutyrate hydrolase family protein [Candidatus Cloacimonadota bacterium]
MILIYNTIIDAKARDNFTQNIALRITFGKEFQVLTLKERIPDLRQFSHLLITGSELSAALGSEWDAKIISVTEAFLKMEKPILGICHGHQILAKAISGNQACQRSPQPEFGWKKMQIVSNPLFNNVSQPIFLESRYDEVCNLQDRCEVIASNNNLAIQAFQLRNRPVWGMQFHPEMMWDDGNKML